MNDRELLEMAAKAAGYKWDKHIAEKRAEAGLIGLWITSVSTCWNTLEDDGDALRLAVKVPNLDLKWIIAAAWQACDTEEERNAYVRRAITCAAAEIGKAMP